MKQINFGFAITLVFLLILSSCVKEPVASFEFDKNNVKAPVTVNFTNTSINADEFLWNFGDGVTSTEENPSHEYVKGGDFDISLKAYNDDGTHTSTSTITILPGMSGFWMMNFNLFQSTYSGRLKLIEYENHKLGGEFAFLEDPEYTPVLSTSKIEDDQVFIEVTLFFSIKMTFRGTVNSTYDYMSGDFLFNGNPSGNWHATKD